MFRNSILRNPTVFFLAFLGSQLTGNKTLYGAEFICPSGDVTCLIAAINEANSTPGDDIINLEAGTYSLVAVNNNVEGPTGLPSITSKVTINGAGADVTIIERDPNLPFPPPPAAEFRIFHVSSEGILSLNRLTVRDGVARTVRVEYGGGIASRGTVTINDSVISNSVSGGGGGIANMGGTIVITSSVISQNSAVFSSLFAIRAGGGILSFGGTATIMNSTFSGNHGTEISAEVLLTRVR
jgi:hypothetical protein